MKKSTVYSWRLSPELKMALEDAARTEGTSVARLLDRIVTAWLMGTEAEGDDTAVQQRLHAAVERTLGTIRGGAPQRAAQARERLRDKLRPRDAHLRLD